MTRVVVRFVIEPMVVVYLSLWDDAASMFRGLINSGDMTQSVMVATTVNPKIFGGNLFLNSTPAMKFYFDPDLQAIAEFIASLEGPVGEGFPCIDTEEGIKKKEVVSIGELNKFISNSDEHTHEADFIRKARVVEFLQQNGWSFVYCTGCSMKLDKIGTSLRCNRCVNPNVTGVIKEMLKVTKKDAAGLTLYEISGGGSKELPQCLTDLAGKDFVFQIRVTPFNFTPSHRTFTVSATLDNITPETFKTSEDQFVQVEGGEASASASNKIRGEDNEPNPSTPGGKESGRKRPRAVTPSTQLCFRLIHFLCVLCMHILF
ncbi:PREDICTED: uncharacterized protein LOC106293643 [Brassica oleracea var. oleracea]|nr:PREDICTED: uncharacterized protein LOC106293643 [Brassica oleracea var. oleracea]